MPEETPYALCQNRPKITRPDPPIFGGTFFRPSETRAAIYRRNDLWDPGPPVIKEEKDLEKVLRIEFGYRSVSLPDRDVLLALVVVKGFGQEPLMLLTNLPSKKTRKSLWWAVESYITRWKIEETIRFIKQCYQLEDIRLLTYIRLQNTMALVMAVAYFTMAYLGLRAKLRVLAGHVLRAARRIFGIPEFRFYALADGIKEHLFGQKRGIQDYFSAHTPDSGQRLLFFP